MNRRKRGGKFYFYFCGTSHACTTEASVTNTIQRVSTKVNKTMYPLRYCCKNKVLRRCKLRGCEPVACWRTVCDMSCKDHSVSCSCCWRMLAHVGQSRLVATRQSRFSLTLKKIKTSCQKGCRPLQYMIQYSTQIPIQLNYQMEHPVLRHSIQRYLGHTNYTMLSSIIKQIIQIK